MCLRLVARALMPGRLALASWFSGGPRGPSQTLPSLDLIVEEERAKKRGTTFKAGLKKLSERYHEAVKKTAVKTVPPSQTISGEKRKRSIVEADSGQDDNVKNNPPQATPQISLGNPGTAAEPNEFERYSLVLISPLFSRSKAKGLLFCCFVSP